MGNVEEAIAVYDEVIARFGSTTEVQVRKYVAEAMVKQGEVLESLGGKEEAIEVYDEIIRRFGEAREPALREQVGRALLKRRRWEQHLSRFHTSRRFKRRGEPWKLWARNRKN